MNASTVTMDPDLPVPDQALLQNLLRDVDLFSTPSHEASPLHDDASTLQKLQYLQKEPILFTNRHLQAYLPANPYVAHLRIIYTNWASTVLRHPTDVVFLNHLLLYLGTLLPSALYLFHSFSWPHAILHGIATLASAGPFTLLLHNAIHGNGVLHKDYAILDATWQILLEPLMGHTWHSYFYHHVKHHHAENNGPGDLSSTLRYQRDSKAHFAFYVLRFLLVVWAELPLYFARKGRWQHAAKAAFFELGSYAFIITMCRWRLAPAIVTLVIPLFAMRVAMMAGNWGQHALVDETDPTSDFRSSITLLDVPSNRYCFNDGYHTSHHLNPLRHWRAHPVAVLKAKQEYASNGALTFINIDYMVMTIKLLSKDYAYLAERLVPMGEEQMKMTKVEIAEMLRSKTRRFTEEEIQAKFGKSN